MKIWTVLLCAAATGVLASVTANPEVPAMGLIMAGMLAVGVARRKRDIVRLEYRT